MKRILSLMRRAVDTYHMIEEHDRIAVGLSGGKDSVVLLCALIALQKFYPKQYELEAVTLDPCFHEKLADYTKLEALCEKLGVPYTIRRTDLYRIVFVDRKEKNPCSLCAKMRRGMLHDAAKERGCNKIALGHHYNDAAETFLMNLLLGGHIGCFSPVSYLSRKDLTMIRPLCLTPEEDIAAAARREGLPIVKSACPVDKTTKRREIGALIEELEERYPKLKQKILGAMIRGGVDRWGW